MPDDTFDPEVADFVESLPRELGYAELAARIAQRFGAERSWPAEKVRRFWLERHPRRRGGQPRIDDKPELRAAVLDLAGRLPLDDILRHLRVRFGDSTPGRSTVARFIRATRENAAPPQQL